MKKLWKKNLMSYLLELFREQSKFSSYFIARNLSGDFRVVLISRYRQKAMFLCISISCLDQISLLCDVQEHLASKKSDVRNDAEEVKHQRENIAIKGIRKLK